MGVRRNFSKGAGNVIILRGYVFLVADVAMQMDVHKTLYCFYTTRKCPVKPRASFASILKPFSSEAVYEFTTKLYFLSSVTAFC